MKNTFEIKQAIGEHEQVFGSDVLASDMNREQMSDFIAHLSKNIKALHESKTRSNSRIHELNETLKAVKSICDAKIN